MSALDDIAADPTATPSLQVRYDILVRELQRERAVVERLHADLHAAFVETRKLRQALGLAIDTPPTPARNMDGGHG